MSFTVAVFSFNQSDIDLILPNIKQAIQGYIVVSIVSLMTTDKEKSIQINRRTDQS